MSGYQEALEAAGAKVLAFDKFGSYQGDWIAKVEYDGQTFWVHDYYGSCSGCDAFEGDLGYYWEGSQYNDYDSREAYDRAVAEFGKQYLEPSERMTYDEIHKYASQHKSWDSDAEDMIKFVEAHKE